MFLQFLVGTLFSGSTHVAKLQAFAMALDAFVFHLLYLAWDMLIAALATIPTILGVAIELLWAVFLEWYRGTFTITAYNRVYTIKYVDICVYLLGCLSIVCAYRMFSRACALARALLYYDGKSVAYRTSPISAFYPQAGETYEPEGAWGHQASFSLSKSETVPPGVFQILEKNTETPEFLHIGFGVLIAGIPYTAYHVVCNSDASYYASLPGSKIRVPIKVDPDCTTTDEDWCSLTCNNLGSILGVKSLSVGCISQGAITVYHFDSEKQCFDQQCVYPTRYDEANQAPIHIYSRTNTAPSDSGLPVLQKGKVVGIHVGSLPSKKQNVHVIPTDLVLPLARVRARQQDPVFEYLSESIPFSKDSKQLRDLVSLKDRKLEKAEARMRGEHLNYQGYESSSSEEGHPKGTWSKKGSRKPNLKQPDLNPTFRGDSWANMMDMEFESGALKGVAPTRGALLSSPGELKMREEIAQLRSSISGLTLLVTTGLRPTAPAPPVSTAPDSSMVEVEVSTETPSNTPVLLPSPETPSSKRKKKRSKKSKTSNLVSSQNSAGTTTLPKGGQ